MTRRCLALSVLLLLLALSNFQRAAHGQSFFDGRCWGHHRYDVCPLLGEQIYDCGFGVSQGDSGYLKYWRVRASCALSDLVPQWANDWFDDAGDAVKHQLQVCVAAASNSAYITGYDPVYDAAVYGGKVDTNDSLDSNPAGYIYWLDEDVSEETADASDKMVMSDAEYCFGGYKPQDLIQDEVEIEESNADEYVASEEVIADEMVDDDYSEDDYSEEDYSDSVSTNEEYLGNEYCRNGFFDGCWPSAPMADESFIAKPVDEELAADEATNDVIANELDAEPKSVEDYFVLYGNRRDWLDFYPNNPCYSGAYIRRDENAAHNIDWIAVSSDIVSGLRSWAVGYANEVRDSEFAADLNCRWEGLNYQIRFAINQSVWMQALRGNYEGLVAAELPAVTEEYNADAEYDWMEEVESDEDLNLGTPAEADMCGPLAQWVVRGMARSLNEAGLMLQNASEQLNSMVENQTVETSDHSEYTD